MTTQIPVDHPGVYIAEELEARGWLQRDLAFILGIADQSVHNLVSGKIGITARMAKSLADAFGVSADLFLGLQKQYDLSKAKAPDEGVLSRARVLEKYPLREMIKRGWIEDVKPSLLESQLAHFFEVDDFDKVPHMHHAARKTNYHDETPSVQVAWLFRVRQVAKETVIPKYSKRKLEGALEQMKNLLLSPEEIRHVPRLLSECGVRFLVVEGLPGGRISGVCTWLDGHSPVIGITTLYNRIDNFWFVLRHEIEHVLNKDGLDEETIDTDEQLDQSAENLPVEEQRANEAAANFCIPSERLESFYNRKNPYFSRKDVLAFAARMNVHPGIAVGQLQRRKKKYDFLRDLQVGIRDIITSSAIVDGWGDVAPVNP